MPDRAPEVFSASPDFIAHAHLDAAGYAAAYQASIDDPAAFWSALEGVDHHAAAVSATSTLLAAWNVEPLRPDEMTGTRVDLQTIAARRGLRGDRPK